MTYNFRIHDGWGRRGTQLVNDGIAAIAVNDRAPGRRVLAAATGDIAELVVTAPLIADQPLRKKQVRRDDGHSRKVQPDVSHTSINVPPNPIYFKLSGNYRVSTPDLA